MPDQTTNTSDAAPAIVSYKPTVSTTDGTGKFYENNLAFATREEAEISAKALMRRWMLVTDWRVKESDQPINARIENNILTLLPATPKAEA